MAPLFLNYLLIAPGESFFMVSRVFFFNLFSEGIGSQNNPARLAHQAANEPHAYVAGEILECMARSTVGSSMVE